MCILISTSKSCILEICSIRKTVKDIATDATTHIKTYAIEIIIAFSLFSHLLIKYINDITIITVYLSYLSQVYKLEL